MVNIGFHIVEQEEAEKARRAAPKPTAVGDELAEVKRQIAEIMAQLDGDGGADESLYPLRRELVALNTKRLTLQEQLKGRPKRQEGRDAGTDLAAN